MKARNIAELPKVLSDAEAVHLASVAVDGICSSDPPEKESEVLDLLYAILLRTGRGEGLLAAAKRVVGTWDRGDLAASVRQLDDALDSELRIAGHDMSSGYCYCACFQCFETAIGSGERPTFCHDCADAGCDDDPSSDCSALVNEEENGSAAPA